MTRILSFYGLCEVDADTPATYTGIIHTHTPIKATLLII